MVCDVLHAHHRDRANHPHPLATGLDAFPIDCIAERVVDGARLARIAELIEGASAALAQGPGAGPAGAEAAGRAVLALLELGEREGLAYAARARAVPMGDDGAGATLAAIDVLRAAASGQSRRF